MAIPLAVPLVMAAASAASSIFGAKQSADANEEAQRKLEAEKAALEAERRRKKYETWASTASGQNTIRMLQDQAQRFIRQQQGAAAVGGATDAAVAQEKELQNMKQAEIIAQANANFEDRKDQVDASYRQQLSGINQQQIAADRAKSQAIASAASGVSSALAQGAVATLGGTKWGQEMMGVGSPAGGGTTPAQAPTAPSQLEQMPKVEMPTIGNQMFMHQFGRIAAPVNRYEFLTDIAKKYIQYPS